MPEVTEDFTGFSATWKIENFLYCPHKKQEELVSPSFVVNDFSGSKWHLCLYPRGNDPDRDEEVGFYLFREDTHGPDVLKVDYELSVVMRNGTLERSVRVSDHPFGKNHCCGISSFVSRSELVQDKEMTLSDGHILTLRCVMRFSGAEVFGECSMATRFDVEEGSIPWSIDNFSKLKTGQPKVLMVETRTPEFPSLKVKLHIAGGYVRDRNIQIEITRTEATPSAYCLIRFRVLSSHGIDLEMQEDEFWFQEGHNRIWMFPVFLTQNRVLEKKNLFLGNNDVLSLKFDCFMSSAGVTSSDIQYICNKFDDASCQAIDDLLRKPEESPSPTSSISEVHLSTRERLPPPTTYVKEVHLSNQEKLPSPTSRISEVHLSNREALLSPTTYVKEAHLSNQETLPSPTTHISEVPFQRSSGVVEATPGVKSEIPIARRATWQARNYPVACNYGEVAPSFRHDMLRMYESEVLCDFTIRAGAQMFPVHKVLLSVRSPVFGAMFGSGMMEDSSDFLEVPDVDAETMHRLLVYIYSDVVEPMEWHAAAKLFVAADKYAVLPLKQMCSNVLASNLTPENALDAFTLVDMHHDADLKAAVMEFILRNDFHVFGSEAWKKFHEENFELAFELMNITYSRKLGVSS